MNNTVKTNINSAPIPLGFEQDENSSSALTIVSTQFTIWKTICAFFYGTCFYFALNATLFCFDLPKLIAQIAGLVPMVVSLGFIYKFYEVLFTRTTISFSDKKVAVSYYPWVLNKKESSVDFSVIEHCSMDGFSSSLFSKWSVWCTTHKGDKVNIITTNDESVAKYVESEVKCRLKAVRRPVEIDSRSEKAQPIPEGFTSTPYSNGLRIQSIFSSSSLCIVIFLMFTTMFSYKMVDLFYSGIQAELSKGNPFPLFFLFMVILFAIATILTGYCFLGILFSRATYTFSVSHITINFGKLSFCKVKNIPISEITSVSLQKGELMRSSARRGGAKRQLWRATYVSKNSESVILFEGGKELAEFIVNEIKNRYNKC